MVIQADQPGWGVDPDDPNVLALAATSHLPAVGGSSREKVFNRVRERFPVGCRVVVIQAMGFPGGDQVGMTGKVSRILPWSRGALVAVRFDQPVGVSKGPLSGGRKLWTLDIAPPRLARLPEVARVR